MRDMFLKIQKKTKNDGDTITLDKNVWMEMLEDVNQSLWKKKREVKRECVKWRERRNEMCTEGKNSSELSKIKILFIYYTRI